MRQKFTQGELIAQGLHPEFITPMFLKSQGMSCTFPARFLTKITKTDECHLWNGAKSGGYGVIGFGAAGTGLIRANRASWILHRGPIPDGMDILHNCQPNKDNPACVRIEHLWLGVAHDNLLDASTKYKQANGNVFWRSLFTAEQIRTIRSMYASGLYTQEELAKMFHVGQYSISHIVRRQTYKDVT